MRLLCRSGNKKLRPGLNVPGSPHLLVEATHYTQPHRMCAEQCVSPMIQAFLQRLSPWDLRLAAREGSHPPQLASCCFQNISSWLPCAHSPHTGAGPSGLHLPHWGPCGHPADRLPGPASGETPQELCVPWVHSWYLRHLHTQAVTEPQEPFIGYRAQVEGL